MMRDTNQTYWEITSDSYANYIKDYCMGIGPWKDNIVSANSNNYLEKATDEVVACRCTLTYRNDNSFLHFDFNQDPFAEYDYRINKVGVDWLFTDFIGSLRKYQEWSSPLHSKELREGLEGAPQDCIFPRTLLPVLGSCLHLRLFDVLQIVE